MDKESAENATGRDLFLILAAALLTGLFFVFSDGIFGNDFWWHVKAGEWMFNNRSLPGVDVFSWYARENGLVWASHEWLSQVFFHLIYRASGAPGIYAVSLFSAALMLLLILFRNKAAITRNILSATLFLAPLVQSFSSFYGRPQVFSYYLIFLTIHCLYRFKNDENSKAIFLIPVFSIFWANLHAGSSTLSYILCLIFFFSGLIEFSWGKLKFEKNSLRQSLTYFIVALLAIAAIGLNPYGIDMIIYPYANMGDAFMQQIINEWHPPDAKKIYHLVVFFVPLLACSLALVATEKKIRATDLFLFLFFAYMFFRSIRFAVVFAIASSFFVFDYAIPRKTSPENQSNRFLLILTCALLVFANLMFLGRAINTHNSGKLISVAIDKEFIDFVHKQSPKRLFNDYNFGETLIFNGIETFADARADLFSPHNLKDMMSLLNLVQADVQAREKSMNPQILIEKYNFDAFLLRTNSSLASFLRTRPDIYPILKESEQAVYFTRIQNSSNNGGQTK